MTPRIAGIIADRWCDTHGRVTRFHRCGKDRGCWCGYMARRDLGPADPARCADCMSGAIAGWRK